MENFLFESSIDAVKIVFAYFRTEQSQTIQALKHPENFCTPSFYFSLFSYFKIFHTVT